MTRLSVAERLVLWFCGSVRVRTRNGLPVYAFRCFTHGLVEASPSGWRPKLICPDCLAALGGTSTGC